MAIVDSAVGSWMQTHLWSHLLCFKTLLSWSRHDDVKCSRIRFYVFFSYFKRNTFSRFLNGHVNKLLENIQCSVLQHEFATALNDQISKCRVWQFTFHLPEDDTQASCKQQCVVYFCCQNIDGCYDGILCHAVKQASNTA